MKISRGILAGWIVAWMLFASLLSANPALHEQFHENAGQPTHQCAVTLLEQQQLLTGEPQLFVFALESTEFDLTLPAAVTLVSQSDIRLLPTRGPPVLS